MFLLASGFLVLWLSSFMVSSFLVLVFGFLVSGLAGFLISGFLVPVNSFCLGVWFVVVWCY